MTVLFFCCLSIIKLTVGYWGISAIQMYISYFVGGYFAAEHKEGFLPKIPYTVLLSGNVYPANKFFK